MVWGKLAASFTEGYLLWTPTIQGMVPNPNDLLRRLAEGKWLVWFWLPDMAGLITPPKTKMEPEKQLLDNEQQ